MPLRAAGISWWHRYPFSLPSWGKRFLQGVAAWVVFLLTSRPELVVVVLSRLLAFLPAYLSFALDGTTKQIDTEIARMLDTTFGSVLESTFTGSSNSPPLYIPPPPMAANPVLSNAWLVPLAIAAWVRG